MQMEETDAWLQEQRIECFSLLASASYNKEAGERCAGVSRFRMHVLFAGAREKLGRVRSILVSVVQRCGGWDTVPAWHNEAVTKGVALEADMCDAQYTKPKPAAPTENYECSER